ncbi:hypothetical protein BTA51_04830 [Hahella sp. CCB-MM4]|uniref:hypothetical protein n=1 Tax=Hahella sp. (strain CCB-MM4) TaxID=1926491 RepID=UPI000B9C67AA|nr:hypothetical protein [Hahella sp. CCB-MM4]OZG74340.1 hypothetical protein BTA51_04830 [Hahella sp. CCB-MM4]
MGTIPVNNGQATNPMHEVANNVGEDHLHVEGNRNPAADDRHVAPGLVGNIPRTASNEQLNENIYETLVESKKDLLFGSAEPEFREHAVAADNVGEVQSKKGFLSRLFPKATPPKTNIIGANPDKRQLIIAAESRLRILTTIGTGGKEANNDEFHKAVDCLNRMRPEIREKFVEMLALEHRAEGSGIDLTQWSNLFGAAEIPYKVIANGMENKEWQFLPLPKSIRDVEVDLLRKDQIRGAWDDNDGLSGYQRTENYANRILTEGLDLAEWGGWQGSFNEGRARSCAGYKLANDMGLHWSLMRFPANMDEFQLLG